MPSFSLRFVWGIHASIFLSIDHTLEKQTCKNYRILACNRWPMLLGGAYLNASKLKNTWHALRLIHALMATIMNCYCDVTKKIQSEFIVKYEKLDLSGSSFYSLQNHICKGGVWSVFRRGALCHASLLFLTNPFICINHHYNSVLFTPFCSAPVFKYQC